MLEYSSSNQINMKKQFFIFLSLTALVACNSTGKDSVETADSINQVIQDSNLNNNTAVVTDQESSEFLTKVTNSGMAEIRMADFARKNAVYPDVRSFAEMLYSDHSAVSETVKNLASQKNVTLPAMMTDDKQQMVDALEKKTGKNIDKEFISTMVKNHEAGVDMFDKAQLNTKDTDIRDFAGKTLPTLKMHLEEARALQKKY